LRARRQRGIVLLDHSQNGGEAGLRYLAHALDDFRDVDRAALDRPCVGERFHAVEQRDDAVGLVADETRQLVIGRRRILLEELRRRADAESGFFTSCARIAAISVTERRRLRWSAGGRSYARSERS